MRLALLLVFYLCLTQSYAHSATGQRISVPDGWEGNVYTDDSTGGFSHCAASAPYLNGTAIIVSIDAAYRWHLGFLNPSWRLNPKDQVSIGIRIDSSTLKSYIATAMSSDFLLIDMPTSDQEIINLFRFGRGMRIGFNAWQHSADGTYASIPRQYDFELKGTSRLLRQLAQCVKEQLSPPEVSSKAAPKPQKEAKSAEPQKEEPTKPTEPKTSTGTGIIVSEAGLILTNFHVVDGCSAISFSKEGELTRSASLLRTDKTNDLALLKSDKSFGPSDVASFRITPSMKAGEQVAVYGFPLTGLLSLSGNVVSGNVSSLAGVGDDVRFYQVSAPVQPGNSGGPLLDYGGNVVGIVTARIDDFVVAGATGALPQNVNFAIKSQIATSFMDTHGVEYRAASQSTAGTLDKVVDAAKKFTVLIECKSK